MRVSRAIGASIIGLGVGYLAGLLAAVWLRWAVPGSELVWNFVSPFRIAAWVLGAAHGAPFVVRSAAGVSAPQAPASIGRVTELLGGSEDVVFAFSVLLVPITILALVGITVAMAVRKAAPTTPRQLLAWMGAAACVQGVGLALAARAGTFEYVVEGDLAPEIGFGRATGHVAIALGHRPLVALAIGAVWGAAFTAAGGMSALGLRTALHPDSRVVLRGWMRGLGTATAIVAGAMAIGGIYAVISGRAPAPPLVALGGFLLSANAVASAIVLAHGASMRVALDAGPFTGWERIDFVTVGSSGAGAPRAMWLLVLIPLAAGVVAGRFARRRSSMSDTALAVRYGGLWGLTLAVFALLLRVRVLSSFSVGALDLGGGSAAFDPLVALMLGALWGTIAALIGARTARPPPAAHPVTTKAVATWRCGNCGMTNASADAYCVSCGALR